MSPNPTFKFARSFIHPCDDFPACAFADETDSLWNLMREDIYSLLMNDRVTPKLDGVTNKFPRIVRAAWSPGNFISPSQCVLAILSSAGVVELLHKVSNNWYSICNVSSFRLKMIQDGKMNKCDLDEKSSDQSTQIVESVRKLQACSMTWSELFKVEEASFVYFSVAYCNGDIFVWKIPRISDLTKSVELVCVGTIYLDDALKSNVLCWITVDVNQYLIIVGYYDGTIRGIRLTDRDNRLQMTSAEKYVAPDHIAVDYLHTISKDKSEIKILAAKGCFLLFLRLSSIGELKGIRHLRVQGRVTGVIPFVDEQFLITTQNSHIFVVNTQSNDLVNINIGSDLPQTRVQYLGLAYSPNKVIFARITSPNTVYDHLVTREPSTIHLFTLKAAICDPWSIIENGTNLGSIWDCMEVLRLKAAKADDPCTVLRPIPRNLESLSLYKLQVFMWMAVIMNVCTTKKPMPNIHHVKECKITEALPLIFLHSACTYLENATKKSTLSEDQMFAVFMLRRHLQIHRDEGAKNEHVNQRIREILNTTAFYPNQIEKCNLCGETIDEIYVRSCPQGHMLSRCCTTLLQIMLLEYRVCPICSQIFHPCLQDMYEEPRCQFCDVPILHNAYDFDAEHSELYGRNLSLPRIEDIEASQESRDTELEESTDSQKPSKWDTSHASSVIVNDDDDESGITEKWEEF
ncbi:PREDICTED: uncharacterized protein LOC105566340 isoform X2 [Vollenhovia emeryi]|nr:PREDICTED: uncharacterized protein LOC105566340 isoform X2 [Vollenhovia emeryi]